MGFIKTGSTLLDNTIGGGWALGRMSNIIGDKSTGKTLLAIEACSNFSRQFPEGKIFYRESEAAFDMQFAAGLGMPVDKIDFLPDPREPNKGDFLTVEDLSRDVDVITKKYADRKTPILYVTDSVDALSDEGEQKLEVGEGSYNTGKAKMLSQFFRQRVRPINDCRMHLMFISQIRDNIGVTFGKKYTRSGGHALDFYASQVIYLAHKGFIKRTSKGVERPVGVDIRVKCEKNKICTPYRECEIPIMFGYGIDDLRSCIEWLYDVKQLDRVIDNPVKGSETKYLSESAKLGNDEYFKRVEQVSRITAEVWKEIEEGFAPVRRKYGD